jgi:3-methyladenine DNA glycosylase AlkD
MPAALRRQLERELAEVADEERARTLAWFFKTGKGDYAEGDCFLGLNVPQQRKFAHRYRDLPLAELAKLLESKWHEHRFVSLTILVDRFRRASEERRQDIFDFYLQHTSRINNWDLVDTSAPYIVGTYLTNRPREILYQLAGSANLWERRIAVVATFAFIKKGDIDETFKICERLLADEHDLIHKACGWALREAGKVSPPALVRFLHRHYGRLPRTTLRYAIERFSLEERKAMLRGEFPR